MAKTKVRYVKFTPEEMAYEMPAEIDFSKGTRMREHPAFKDLFSAEAGYVKLAPDVRKAFKTDRAVNTALRKVLRLRSAERKTKSHAAK